METRAACPPRVLFGKAETISSSIRAIPARGAHEVVHKPIEIQLDSCCERTPTLECHLPCVCAVQTSCSLRTVTSMATVSTPNSLGEMLRRARELRGLTLERIARETKIPQRHLEAFERDNLTALPSGFYQRAELRTYAQAVGLDQRLALAELESALAPVDTREPRETRENRGGASMSPLPYIAAAVAGIAVIAALFGRASVEPAPQVEPRVETPAATDSAPLPGTVPPEIAASSVSLHVAADPTQAAVPVPAESVTALVVK